MWNNLWQDKTVKVYCDNMPAIAVLSNGHGRDTFLLQCAREIWLLSAQHNFTIVPTHKPGSEMIKADALSRAHLHPDFSYALHNLNVSGRLSISPSLFNLDADI